MACRKRSIENDKNSLGEREQWPFKARVCWKERQWFANGEKRRQRGRVIALEIFSPHCQEQWEKRVGDGKGGERDGGEERVIECWLLRKQYCVCHLAPALSCQLRCVYVCVSVFCGLSDMGCISSSRCCNNEDSWTQPNFFVYVHVSLCLWVNF